MAPADALVKVIDFDSVLDVHGMPSGLGVHVLDIVTPDSAAHLLRQPGLYAFDDRLIETLVHIRLHSRVLNAIG